MNPEELLEYILVSETSGRDFEKSLNKLYKLGYRREGEFCVGLSSGGYPRYSQLMKLHSHSNM